MNTRKKTAFGVVGLAATSALVAGGALPAMADSDHESTTTDLTSITRLFGDIGITGGDIESPIVIAPEVGTGGVLSGNVVGSGNDTAVGSGNDTSVGDIGGDVDVTGVVEDVVDGSIGDLLDSVDVDLDTLFED